MTTKEKLDWSECPFIEIKPAVHSGAPVLRGTRLPVGTIVGNFDYGLSAAEIAEQFEIAQDSVETVLAYADRHLPTTNNQ